MVSYYSGFTTYLLTVSYSTCSLLTVSTGKLVTYLRRLDSSNTYFTEFVSFLIYSDHDLEMAEQNYSCRLD